MTERGLLDTSVFIATETGRELDEGRLPDEVAASVVTLAELQAGVLAAKDSDTRAVRLATLDTLADIDVLPVDEDAARCGHHCGSVGMCCSRNQTCGPGSRRTAYVPSLLPGVARTLTAGRGGDRCTGRGGRRVRSWVPSQR